MKKTTKFTAALLSAMMAFGALGAMPMTAGAAEITDGSVLSKTVNETESNDSYDTADTATLGNTISGSLSSYDEEDWYKITPSSNGKISLTFKHTYEDSSGGWAATVYADVNGELKELSSTDIYLYSDEEINLPYIGAAKNCAYYLMISSCYKYDGRSVDKNYTVETSFASSNFYEKELNDYYSSATEVSVGNSFSGDLNSYSDDDYYKLVSPSTGKISLIFKHAHEESTSGWRVTVYILSDGKKEELSSTKIQLNDYLEIDLPYIGAVKDCTYYIKVENLDSYATDPVGKNYTVETSLSTSSSYEKEINNYYDTATDIVLDKSCSGNLNSSGDKDYYKLVSSSSGKIYFTFEHETESSTQGWKVEVLDSEFTQLSYDVIDLNENETVELLSIDAVKGDTYYIIVRSEFETLIDSVGKNYTITASTGTSATLGDVNGDNNIDISDATAIQKSIAQIASLTDEQKKAADVNGDGTIDISDATMIQKYVAKIITEFTAAK